MVLLTRLRVGMKFINAGPFLISRHKTVMTAQDHSPYYCECKKLIIKNY
jgi:hypothetical protein